MSGFEQGRGSFRGGGRESDDGRSGGGRDSGRVDSRGRGRGDSGRGGGRGDGGGRGGNPHMGTQGAILSLLSGKGLQDNDILNIINPPMKDRDRSVIVKDKSYSESLPKPVAFREVRIGCALPSTCIVRTNHFKFNTSSISHNITYYHVHLYRTKNGIDTTADIAAEEDARNTFVIMRRLRERHPEWNVTPDNKIVGFVYDGRSSLYTSSPIKLPAKNADNQPYISDIFGLSKADGSESDTRTFRIALTEIATIITPASKDDPRWRSLDRESTRALDLVIFNFGRIQLGETLKNMDWYVNGSNLFNAESRAFPISSLLEAKQGWHASIRSLQGGLLLVSDLSVNIFLASGDMPELLYKAADLRNFEEFRSECTKKTGLSSRLIDLINKTISNLKVKINHIGHSKKCKKLGPASNSPDSAFEYEGQMVTVEKYYILMAAKNLIYRKIGKNGKLKYPELPTINIGSNTKPILIPPELVSVTAGQVRNHNLTGDATAKMIKCSAIMPNDRMQHIINQNSLVNIMPNDPTAKAFGLNNLDPMPMQVNSVILPPPKLQYGKNGMIEPGLNGTWNTDRPQRQQFVKLPPSPHSKMGYMYGIVVVGDGPPRNSNWKELLNGFTKELEREALSNGVKLTKGGDYLTSTDNQNSLKAQFEKMKGGGVRIVLIVMCTDSYGSIKLVADTMGLPSQCIRWAVLEKSPRGLQYNMMLKMNTKLGGTNHTLKSRLPPNTKSIPTFQNPPASISWIFDKPCMVVGIDVSHPEQGTDHPSMAAVVGSMDGSLCQYVAHISSQKGKVEMVLALTDAIRCLFTSFKGRNNGKVPETIIVYRDGVADSQYDQVLEEEELPSIRTALELEGFMVGETIKLAIVVCTKGHKTRLFYQDSDGRYINPCPGLIVDNTIVNDQLNEFYLNSHAAIQGTCKPCKYTLIYDEIGFKLGELQLLTYWTTYLYARANKSVSYATPAYYAHWASKRARDLMVAGASEQHLLDISATWSKTQSLSTMFFI